MALFGTNAKDKRPVFLNLFQIHLPVTALVSILHRVSGVYDFRFTNYAIRNVCHTSRTCRVYSMSNLATSF